MDIVKLQASLTVQSKSVGQGVDFVFPPSQQQLTTLTKIYQKEMYYTQFPKDYHWKNGHQQSQAWSPTNQN